MSIVRPRTARACDRCSTARARCDGMLSCRRCQEYGHTCQYTRPLKKRGRKREDNSNKSRNDAEESPDPSTVNNQWQIVDSPTVLEHSPVQTSEQQVAWSETSPTISNLQSQLEQVNPYIAIEEIKHLLDGIVEFDLARELFDLYFAEPGGGLFADSSPYVLSSIIRKEAIARNYQRRKLTPALIVTILWTSAHTITTPALLRPGDRSEIISELEKLALLLFHDRDVDHWHRFDGILRPTQTESNDKAPLPTIDDVLTLVLMTIVISGGAHKSDSLNWWSKAVRLARLLGLNRLDGCSCAGGLSRCNMRNCALSHDHPEDLDLQALETKEESRRLFWLLFSLDRHFALSFNTNISISDDECLVFMPMPDTIWNDLHNWQLSHLPTQRYGPSTIVTGIGYFEYFLPLMTILGDVIHLHHRRYHPRLHHIGQYDYDAIEQTLQRCTESVHHLRSQGTETPRRTILVTLYSQFVLHVLYVLLHGRWDAMNMLATGDLYSSSIPDLPFCHPHLHDIGEWITSTSFGVCATNAIAASEIVSEILLMDPELTFMPYLFGIYLLHGSFILLLFADRMPEVAGGPHRSVEKACETIIRAHEVCVVTLTTEFQKHFRKVLRATLSCVRDRNNNNNNNNDPHRSKSIWSNGDDTDTSPQVIGDGLIQTSRKAQTSKARQELFSLYRWTNGSPGLCL